MSINRKQCNKCDGVHSICRCINSSDEEKESQQELVKGICFEINALFNKRKTALDTLFPNGYPEGVMNVLENFVGNAIEALVKKPHIDRGFDMFIEHLNVHREYFKKKYGVK